MNSGLSFLWVALGGALGASLRYSVSLALLGHCHRFPYATLIVNLVGAFAAGIVTTLLFNRGGMGMPLQLFLVAGFLGGFTTFSAFSVETLRLFEAGQQQLALLNVGLNVFGSLLAVWLGVSLARLLSVG